MGKNLISDAEIGQHDSRDSDSLTAENTVCIVKPPAKIWTIGSTGTLATAGRPSTAGKPVKAGPPATACSKGTAETPTPWPHQEGQQQQRD